MSPSKVDDVGKAVAFYQDIFNLEKPDEGEGDAFFKLGEHQFLAMFKVEGLKSHGMRHFGILMRDEKQLAAIREKILNDITAQEPETDRTADDPQASCRIGRSVSIAVAGHSMIR
jgi:catechol-2,3-dioxygenase